jgi:hypothetical protein
MRRVRRVTSQEELERLVDDFTTRGYSIKSKGQDEAHLKDKDWGDSSVHLFLFVLTSWWTFGLSNTLYAIYKRISSEEVLIQVVGNNRNGSSKIRKKKAEAQMEITGYQSNASRREVVSQYRSSLSNTTHTDGNWLNINIHNKNTPRYSANKENSQEHLEELDSSSQSFAFIRFLQLSALLVSVFVLFSIFTIRTGIVGVEYIREIIFILGSLVIFRYVIALRSFKKTVSQHLLGVLCMIAILGAIGVVAGQMIKINTVNEIKNLIYAGIPRDISSAALPEWWSGILLIIALIFLLVGNIRIQSNQSYRKIEDIRLIQLSAPVFGFACALIGLWAVLFVGFSIQRIVVIAPLFEELLKFGVALLVGSTLFNRSFAARIGVAIVVGTLFGLIEHSTTYPTEPDYSYVFRTLFHLSTTVLSVTTYTVWRGDGEDMLPLIAPAFSIWVHFFNNTFAVISSLIFSFIYVPNISSVTPIFSFLTVFITSIVTLLVIMRHRSMKFLTQMIASTFLPKF